MLYPGHVRSQKTLVASFGEIFTTVFWLSFIHFPVALVPVTAVCFGIVYSCGRVMICNHIIQSHPERVSISLVSVKVSSS